MESGSYFPKAVSCYPTSKFQKSLVLYNIRYVFKNCGLTFLVYFQITELYNLKTFVKHQFLINNFLNRSQMSINLLKTNLNIFLTCFDRIDIQYIYYFFVNYFCKLKINVA